MAVTLVAKVVKCERCNRKLTNPESIKLGYGKVCWEKSSNGLVTKKQTTQMVDKLSAARIEDLEAKVLQAFDAIEELKKHGVIASNNSPPNISMPSSSNLPLVPSIQPDAPETPTHNGDKLHLEAHIKSEVQTSALYQKMRSTADIGSIVGDGKSKVVKTKPTLDDGIKKLMKLQEQIQGA